MWIDAHIHIYDVTREGVSWPTPASPVLYRKISPADFAATAVGCGVNRAIAVECASEVENNIWTFEYLKDASEICAVTGHINPCSDSFPDIYDRYAAYPKFRGIRIGSWSGCSDREKMDKNIGYLEGKLANVVDLLGKWTDLAQMETLIAGHPDISFVINHIASCPIEGSTPPADYLAFLERMARYENVSMKVSGIIYRTQVIPVPRTLEFYVPVLRSIYEAFGEDRCLYGSDWPVITIKGDYETNFHIVSEFFSRYGRETLEKAMGRNAARIYRITE
jgi:predicted TIM-barrel fold metal-dependent hydrolase